MTASEICGLVEGMRGIVTILQSSTTEDRRKVYEAAQLAITCDHVGRLRPQPKKSELHASPEVWSSVGVGGGKTDGGSAGQLVDP
jgi:hypothetical protein